MTLVGKLYKQMPKKIERGTEWVFSWSKNAKNIL